jgi:hypothetical protein
MGMLLAMARQVEDADGSLTALDVSEPMLELLVATRMTTCSASRKR